jgi:hypothetical protein
MHTLYVGPPVRGPRYKPVSMSRNPQPGRTPRAHPPRGQRSPLVAPFIAILVAMFVAASAARAGVGVILNDSLDTSVERITGSGHTAVYFSHICPESPVKLRLCRPGEEGSVMSNYINIGEDQNYEWNVVPLSVYVYGVENPRHRPLVGTDKIKAALEDRYRDKYLGPWCTTEACRKSDKSEWREMVGAGLSRNFYIFFVETTEQQDLEIIARFNADPNVNHFNGAIRNCADFTKDAVNAYFPHSAHRDFLNDFGMTSPKAVARSFTRYAIAHPEMQFRVLHFSQTPGTIKRSTEPHSGTEQLYHSKKLLVPMLLFADYELAGVAASYLLTGRFNSQHQYEAHSAASPTAPGSDAPGVTALKADPPDASKDSSAYDPAAEPQKLLEIQERDAIVGTPDEWKAYRKAVDGMIDDCVREEFIPDRGYLKRLLKDLDKDSKITVTPNGSLWMDVPTPGGTGTTRVGLSASNILSRNSDPRLAYEILLDRADRELRSPMHSRETMIEFKQNWDLLQTAAKNPLRTSAASSAGGSSNATAAAAGAAKSTSAEPRSAANKQK